jgi:hypothetical protein
MGSASAVASETMPRIDVQATSATAFGLGIGSRRRTSALIQRGNQVATGTQIKRTLIATSPMITPVRATDPSVPGGTCCTSAPNCAPRTRKIDALSRNTNRSHVARVWIRELGETTVERCWRT